MSDELLVSLTDDQLLSDMTNTENNFIERKTIANHRGWLETAVAFANSCPIGYPGVLYVGVDDDGKVQQHKDPPDFETLQKNVTSKINNAWPPIYHLTKALRRDEAEFLAVLIPGSPLRPHFSGPAYVRIGPETRDASEEQYDQLIAQRSSKVRALQKLVGKTVFWHSISSLAKAGGNANATLVECNQFFVTLDSGTSKRCFPVDWITISFEPRNSQYALLIRE